MQYSSDPYVMPDEQCRLPGIVPVESLGTDGVHQRESEGGIAGCRYI